MRLEKVLIVVGATLLVALIAQIGIRSYHSQPNTSASWRYYPKSVEEARKLSSHIVVGKVERIQSGRLQPKGEGKFEEDVSLPAEVVTFRVEATYAGDKMDKLELFHTGTGESTYNRPAPREKPPKPPEKGAVPQTQRPPKPTEEQARPILLMDDPVYREGESYLLFLMDGPEVTVDGSPVKTMAVISPEGRYRVSTGGRLEPISHSEGLPQKFRGRSVKEMVGEIKQ